MIEEDVARKAQEIQGLYDRAAQFLPEADFSHIETGMFDHPLYQQVEKRLAAATRMLEDVSDVPEDLLRIMEYT